MHLVTVVFEVRLCHCELWRGWIEEWPILKRTWLCHKVFAKPKVGAVRSSWLKNGGAHREYTGISRPALHRSVTVISNNYHFNIFSDFRKTKIRKSIRWNFFRVSKLLTKNIFDQYNQSQRGDDGPGNPNLILKTFWRYRKSGSFRARSGALWYQISMWWFALNLVKNQKCLVQHFDRIWNCLANAPHPQILTI